jgi:uncharacterized metal-binding protein
LWYPEKEQAARLQSPVLINHVFTGSNASNACQVKEAQAARLNESGSQEMTAAATRASR